MSETEEDPILIECFNCVRGEWVHKGWLSDLHLSGSQISIGITTEKKDAYKFFDSYLAVDGLCDFLNQSSYDEFKPKCQW